MFLAEARKHAGVLIYLAQNISQFYVALGCGGDKAKADAFLGNFGHIITHVCDMETAKYMAERNGKELQAVYGASQEGGKSQYQQAMGAATWTANLRMEERFLVDPLSYTRGRTGGRENGLICSSIVYRSGQPFRGGCPSIHVPWSQT